MISARPPGQEPAAGLVRFTSSAEVPVPYPKHLETAALPQVADVINAVKDVMYLK